MEIHAFLFGLLLVYFLGHGFKLSKGAVGYEQKGGNRGQASIESMKRRIKTKTTEKEIQQKDVMILAKMQLRMN